MKFIILTLFPEMFQGPFDHSIIKRAIAKDKLTIEYVNIRDFSEDKHKSVDDHPFGGGRGMVLRVDVVDKALAAVTAKLSTPYKTILLDPRGNTFNQQTAQRFSKEQTLVFVCGHYEGVDERIRDLVDETVSIGNFVVTGGELPVILIVDAVSRLVDGVLPTEEVTIRESFTTNLLEYPQYTRPAEYKGKKVPEVLLSGNHAVIEQWKTEQSKKLTEEIRPDLLTEVIEKMDYLLER